MQEKLRDLTQMVPASDTEQVQGLFKRLFEGAPIALDASAGIVTLEQVRKVTPGYRDSRLLSWKSKPTGALTNIGAYEIVKEGKFPDFFGKTAAEMDRHRWQWAQVVEFVEAHPDKMRLDSRANFFLITTDGEPVLPDFANAFVVGMNFGEAGPIGARLRSFSDPRPWDVKDQRRIFFPQVEPSI